MGGRITCFRSVGHPLVTRTRTTSTQGSLSKTVLTLCEVSRTDPTSKRRRTETTNGFRGGLRAFFALPSLRKSTFRRTTGSLPNYSSLGPERLTIFGTGLRHLPTPTKERRRVRRFSLVPTLSALSKGRTRILSGLVTLPLSVGRFRATRRGFIRGTIQSSFFVPVVYFTIMLVCNFFFHGARLGGRRRRGPTRT